jgi:2-octaprenyl-6-methoxyphenol hydroxylase
MTPRLAPHPDATVDVAIVGAGMVGLTLAAALARAGLAVVVVDRAPAAVLGDPTRDGRASALAHASVRALDAVGLWPEIEREAEAIREIRVSDGPSRLFLHYDHRDLGDEPLGYIVENAVIRRALAPRADRPAFRVVAGRRVAAMASGPVDAVLTFDNGAELRAPPTGAARRSARSLVSASPNGRIRRPASSAQWRTLVRIAASPRSASCRPARSPSCR